MEVVAATFRALLEPEAAVDATNTLNLPPTVRPFQLAFGLAVSHTADIYAGLKSKVQFAHQRLDNDTI